jgi:galactitol-specific phosphotransferase system IIB component
MQEPVTHQINQTALQILEQNPEGVRWTDLIVMIKKADPTFHPKTVNGCVWKLVEKFPEKVYRTPDKLFRLKKYQA